MRSADCEKVDFTPYVEQIRAMVDEVKDPVDTIESLINGDDLMFMFDKDGGPWIREIKEALIEKQILGEIKTVREAADFIWSEYSPKYYAPIEEVII